MHVKSSVFYAEFNEDEEGDASADETRESEYTCEEEVVDIGLGGVHH